MGVCDLSICSLDSLPLIAVAGNFWGLASLAILVVVANVLMVTFIVILKRRKRRSPTPGSNDKGHWADENVQFTVYRPRIVQPERWYEVLAFAHVDELPPPPGVDETEGEREARREAVVQEVKRRAARILGPEAAGYRQSSDDSSRPVPRGGDITFVPEIEKVEFNPPRQTFRWLEEIHGTEFRMRASGEAEDGTVLRGKMSVFLDAILLADVNLTIRVDRKYDAAAELRAKEAESARRYHKIFASYSHRDRAIVQQCEQFVHSVGDRYLRDCKDLRSGEVWSERLADFIEEADVFQLFWSRHSMESEFVRREWEHALSLKRSGFIRPVYWEVPRPERPGLPPEELQRIHFHLLDRRQISCSSAAPHGARPVPGRSECRDELPLNDGVPGVSVSTDAGTLMARDDGRAISQTPPSPDAQPPVMAKPLREENTYRCHACDFEFDRALSRCPRCDHPREPLQTWRRSVSGLAAVGIFLLLLLSAGTLLRWNRSPVELPSNGGTPPVTAPPKPEFRTWSIDGGERTVEAKFRGAISDTVMLVERDGTSIKVSMDQLSEADRQWIKERARRRRAVP
jgi:hypothetical protein